MSREQLVDFTESVLGCERLMGSGTVVSGACGFLRGGGFTAAAIPDPARELPLRAGGRQRTGPGRTEAEPGGEGSAAGTVSAAGTGPKTGTATAAGTQDPGRRNAPGRGTQRKERRRRSHETPPRAKRGTEHQQRPPDRPTTHSERQTGRVKGRVLAVYVPLTRTV